MSMKLEGRFEHEMIEVFEDGEMIFEEGETGRDLYIVQEGTVKITKRTNNALIEIAEFTKGDFFGDMALLQSLPRYASAQASGRVRLLILKPAGFLLKIRRDPTFAFEMLQQMSFRVKVSNDRVMEILNRYNLPMMEIQDMMREFGGKL